MGTHVANEKRQFAQQALGCTYQGNTMKQDYCDYHSIILQTDPSDPNMAWNVALQCQFCEAFLSSSNPSKIASTHSMKGGCPEVRGDADIATDNIFWFSSC